MKTFKVDYTVTEKPKVKNLTWVTQAETEEEARNQFYDNCVGAEGWDEGTHEYHAENIEELKYRCFKCEGLPIDMHGIECPTRKRRAFASGKRMRSPKVAQRTVASMPISKVLETIEELCNADNRNRMKSMPVLVEVLTVEQLTEIVSKHE
jgi:hypothetical protein